MTDRPGSYVEIDFPAEILPPPAPLSPLVSEMWVLWLFTSSGAPCGWFVHPNREAVVEKQKEVEHDLVFGFGMNPPRTIIARYVLDEQAP